MPERNYDSQIDKYGRYAPKRMTVKDILRTTDEIEEFHRLIQEDVAPAFRRYEIAHRESWVKSQKEWVD